MWPTLQIDRHWDIHTVCCIMFLGSPGQAGRHLCLYGSPRVSNFGQCMWVGGVRNLCSPSPSSMRVVSWAYSHPHRSLGGVCSSAHWHGLGINAIMFCAWCAMIASQSLSLSHHTTALYCTVLYWTVLYWAQYNTICCFYYCWWCLFLFDCTGNVHRDCSA